ncbi:hypothetical protein [Segetibacter sp.]|uniref:hypothetical protein n=1 Tax=Segetibacter sp. TaxID=2231182 RepID=UPI00263211E2|nr:hypothetical protein [Segetibacter sp.]MCW3081373.1 hypothetical protein [Segetibacter sp.]
MKKILFAIMLSLFIIGSAFAVPGYINPPISESERLKKGLEQTVGVRSFFNASEQKMGDSQKTGENQLPVPAKRTFAKMFNGYTIKQAVRSTESEGECFYISAENDKESIIVKIDETLDVSIFTKCQK